MYYLFPRLPLPVSETLANIYSVKSIEELHELSSTTHPATQFSPTGGNRITPETLNDIQRQVRKCAEDFGFPISINEKQARNFDIKCGVLLFTQMQIHPSEASHLEIWTFLTCVLLPDVVRWRWHSESGSPERFIGSDRGLRRNAFGRLWWRTYLFQDESLEDPYSLLSWFYEDEIVQLTERNSVFASDRRFLNLYCKKFLSALRYNLDISRRDLIRESAKRIQRLRAITLFESLETEMLDSQLSAILDQTMASIRSIEL